MIKILVLGKTRVQANLDIYNLLNGSDVLELNNTFGSDWRKPSRILDPRMMQISGNLTF